MARSAAKMVDPLEWPVLLAMVGSVLIGVTLVLNGVSLVWSVRAVKQSEKNAKTELRAYLNVSRVYLKFPEEVWGPPTVWVLFKNYGTTPAYKVRQVGEMAVKLSGKESFGDPGEAERSIINVSQGQEISLGRHFNEKTWPIQKAHLNDANYNLFVWGRYGYDDVFGKRHSAEYRFWLPYELDGTGEVDLIPCQEGNSPD